MAGAERTIHLRGMGWAHSSLSGRDFLPFLTSLGQTDGNRLLSTLDLAASARWPASGRAALVAVHFALHIGT